MDAELAAGRAQRVGRLVIDRRRRQAALSRLGRVTAKPSVNRWRESGLAMGGAGLALMCAAFDDRFPGDGWDVAGHGLLAAGCAEEGSLALFDGAVGFAAAAWFSSRDGARYPSLLAAIDAALLPRMFDHVRDLPAGPDSYDIVTGISGWAGYLCARAGPAPIDELARAVTAALVELLNPGGVPGIAYRRTANPPARHGLAVDCGLAHGLAGPLAALALLETRFRFGRADVGAGIRWAAGWLVAQAVEADGCVLWPTAIGLDGDEHVRLGADVNGGSWCHGGSGIARALYLAGAAVDDAELREFAVHAMSAQCERPPVLPSPNLCHGVAGQLLLASAFARDTAEPRIERSVQRLTGELLARFRADAPLGYVDVERPGLETDHPGLLRGAAGVALALLVVPDQPMPRWSSLLLLS